MPEQLLADWPSLADVAECAYRAAVRVSVVQACVHSQRLARNGVDYYFQPYGRGRFTNAGTANFAELIRELAPDVLHVHGLHFAQDVVWLAAIAPGVPILLQDHASRPPRR